MAQLEQQPLNRLAPFATKYAEIDSIIVDSVTFADGTVATSASQMAQGTGEPLTSPVECGTF